MRHGPKQRPATGKVDRQVNILGLVTKSHDTGLALLENGVPAYVLEEERFNRQKHTLEFPEQCLDAVFGDGKRSLEDIDAVSYTHLTLPTNREV